MNERIKDIRKALKLTQQAFADKLCVSKSTIEAIEYGRREITTRLFNDICREFNVNEEWLRNGTGEMFAPSDFNSEIASLVANMTTASDSAKTQLLLLLNSASDEDIDTMYDIAKEWVTKKEHSD